MIEILIFLSFMVPISNKLLAGSAVIMQCSSVNLYMPIYAYI